MIDRYYLEEMKKIWSEDNYYLKWKEIEAAVLKARGKKKLAEKLMSVPVTQEEVREKEKVSGHELNAFLEILEENIDGCAGEIHKGLTSSDVMDTARILQMKETVHIIEKALKRVISILEERVIQYRDLVMCGRTHGQFAEPVTLGLKLARFLETGKRSLGRLKRMKKSILVGQINGAVGTYSLVSPEEEEAILKNLGLKPLAISSQVIPRDIFADYLYAMALISSFSEEVAVEIRLLAQDGIKEVTEPFSKRQKGSSAMPHKKNPVICERICGLSRLVRSHVNVGMSNIALWNERDISHSSNERIILEEASSLTYYILKKLEFVLDGMNVHKKNINNNLRALGVTIFSSGILKLLLDKGMGREQAYAITKKLFIDLPSKSRVKKALKSIAGIPAGEVEKVMNFDYYLRNRNKIFKRLGL